MTDRPARDATPAPPWNATMGPPPRVRSWPPGKQPNMRIRVDGQWRRASVRQRQDWGDGRVRVLCDVWLPDGIGGDSAVVRGYWWDAAAMRTG